MKIVFITPVHGDARHTIRLEGLGAYDIESEVLSFEREYYKAKDNNFSFVSLGKIKQGNYIARFYRYLRALSLIRKHALSVDIVYAFGIDLGLLGIVACLGMSARPVIVSDVMDIRKVLLSKTWAGKIARVMQKYTVRRIDLMVVTSAAYISEYYANIAGVLPRKHLVIENKILSKQFLSSKMQESATFEKLPTRCALVIGYFGVLRCARSLEVLLAFASQGQGQVKVILRGILMDTENFRSRIASNPYVDYSGEYLYPDDMRGMYSSIDLIWACYPYSEVDPENWRWARTNRFYEGCFFDCPVIVALGTQDAKEVLHLAIGLVIDLSDTHKCIETLANILKENITLWTSNMRLLPANYYEYSSEYADLVEQLEVIRSK